MVENKEKEIIKIPCEMVEDLLPSYVDELTSDTTNEILGEHLENCQTCAKKYQTMKNPVEDKKLEQQEQKEIDFLKLTKRNFRKKALLSVGAVLVLAVLFIVLRFYVAGTDMNAEYLNYALEVNGKQLRITGQSIGENDIQKVEVFENDGVVEVDVRGVGKSIFYGQSFDEELVASKKIRQVWLGDTIVWADGEKISPLTAVLYKNYNPYVGNMSANRNVVQALNIEAYTGKLKNELQTTKEPYGWKLILENKFKSDKSEEIETQLKCYAYILLAEVGNVGEITFEYYLDSQLKDLTVTVKEATKYAETDIKEVGKDIVKLESLVRKTGLNQYVLNKSVLFGDEMNTDADAFEIELVNLTSDQLKSFGVHVEYGSKVINNS